MQDSSTRRSLFRPLSPRYSLRALLIGVALTAVAVHFGQLGWHRFIRYREARNYAIGANGT